NIVPLETPAGGPTVHFIVPSGQVVPATTVIVAAADQPPWHAEIVAVPAATAVSIGGSPPHSAETAGSLVVHAICCTSTPNASSKLSDAISSTSNVRVPGDNVSAGGVPVRITRTPAETLLPATSRAVSTPLLRPGRSGTVQVTTSPTGVAGAPLHAATATPD